MTATGRFKETKRVLTAEVASLRKDKSSKTINLCDKTVQIIDLKKHVLDRNEKIDKLILKNLSVEDEYQNMRTEYEKLREEYEKVREKYENVRDEYEKVKAAIAIKHAIKSTENVPDTEHVCPICSEQVFFGAKNIKEKYYFYDDQCGFACFRNCGHTLCMKCAKKIAKSWPSNCHKCGSKTDENQILRLYR